MSTWDSQDYMPHFSTCPLVNVVPGEILRKLKFYSWVGERPAAVAGRLCSSAGQRHQLDLGGGALSLSCALSFSLSLHPISKSVHLTKYGNAPAIEGSKLKNEMHQSLHSASVLEKTLNLWNFFSPGYVVWDCDTMVNSHCIVGGDWRPGHTDPMARSCHAEFSLQPHSVIFS